MTYSLITMPHHDTTLRQVTKPGEGRLFLLVLQQGAVATYDLPPEGRITVGRADSSDICIDDPSISRQHAAIHCGETIRLEDLGSANGSTVGTAAVKSGESLPLAPNEPAVLGSVTIVVQRRGQHQRQVRVWSYDYFETRVREECARCASSGDSLGLIRVVVAPENSPRAVQGPLSKVVREFDVVGLYAPGRYEVLVPGCGNKETDELADRLKTALDRDQIQADVTARHFPSVYRNAEQLLAQSDQADPSQQTPIVTSPAMRKIYDLAALIAVGEISVLILGETGVGKQVLAEEIHARSERSENKFLELNCSAFSESLLESELFGHERGAFTGATRSKAGLFESADGGTVFLDEIGEMAPSLQAKLLRVLESREVLRIGSLEPIKVDVRFVAATNRDIEGEVAEGRFREDLYFRVAGATLEVPPLRERRDEIPALARQFLDRFARSPLSISDEAMDLLACYAWPGNLRELRNVMERAALLATGGVVAPEHLPTERFQSNMTTSVPVRSGETGLSAQDSEKRQRILDALASCGGNNSQAADVLGVSRRTLGTWMDQLKIPRPRKGRR